MKPMRLFRKTVKKDGETVRIKKWYAQPRVHGRRYDLPLFEQEAASRKFAEKLQTLINQHEFGGGYDKTLLAWLSQLHSSFLQKFAKMGLIEQGRILERKPIDTHVRDYIDHLRHKGNTENYCRLCETRIRNINEGCKFQKLADITADKVMRFVSTEHKTGRLSEASFNHYVRQFKGFVRWLYNSDRTQADINKHLHLRTITETIKDRRALTIAEIDHLLHWLETGAGTARSLSGFERMVLYKLALTTGLRAAEIRSLKVRSIDFEGKTITVAAGYTKNKKVAVMPLRGDVLNDLAELVRGKLPDAVLFKLTDKTSDIMRRDLAGARVAWIAEAASDAERRRRDKSDFLKTETSAGEIDFHSLRHSFATVLINGGCDVKTAQSLLRHSTPTLTIGLYSHVLRESQQSAIDALPRFGGKAEQAGRKQA